MVLVKAVNLNKLLMLFALRDAALVSELRADARNERDKAAGLKSGGGHFHYPWWTAAKNHVVGIVDLEEQTAFLTAAVKQRRRLYPLLTSGFLAWLQSLRRRTNLSIGWHEVEAHTHYVAPGVDLTVKVDNLLALRLGEDKHKLIYPYFSEEPILDEKWARVGLWLMRDALSKYDIVDMEILDVLRGRSFRGDTLFLRGDEETLFALAFGRISRFWQSLRHDYGV